MTKKDKRSNELEQLLRRAVRMIHAMHMELYLLPIRKCNRKVCRARKFLSDVKEVLK